MTKISCYQRVTIVSIFLLFLSSLAGAQEFNCDNLKKVIQVAASDSTMQSLRGDKEENKIDKGENYKGNVLLWKQETDVFQTEDVQYDTQEKRFNYEASVMVPYGDDEAGKKETEKLKVLLQSCLDSNWILKAEASEVFDSVFYFKNTSNYAEIELKQSSGTILLSCYNDPKNAQKCISGDCDNYLGIVRYFNDDVYSGSFLNGDATGTGYLVSHSSHYDYTGDFVDGQVQGFGTIRDKNGKAIRSGIFIDGKMVKIDTALKTCQYGNCLDGMGLSVTNYGYYIGNFKDGVYDGLGEYVTPKTTSYGTYTNGQLEGQGIFSDKDGSVTFSNFKGNKQSGDYEKCNVDRTTIKSNIETGVTSAFNANGVLIKSGVITKVGFTENSDALYKEEKEFASDMNEFYSYRKDNYKEIIGEKHKSYAVGFNVYDSKKKLQGVNETMVIQDFDNNYFVSVNISAKPANNAQRMTLFNKYYNFLTAALGTQWLGITNQDSAKTSKDIKTVEFQNIFDKSERIKLSLVATYLTLEIH